MEGGICSREEGGERRRETAVVRISDFPCQIERGGQDRCCLGDHRCAGSVEMGMVKHISVSGGASFDFKKPLSENTGADIFFNGGYL